MNQITIEGQRIVINFNKQLYHINTIKEALDDYKEISFTDIHEEDNIIQVILVPKDDNLKSTLGFEFCNYVLGLMKNQGIV